MLVPHRAVRCRHTAPRGDHRATVPFLAPYAIQASLAVFELAQRWAQHKGIKPAQFSPAWLLAQKPLIVPIPGTTNPHHLAENLGAVAIELTPDELQQIRAELSKIKIVGERGSAGAQAMVGVEARVKA